MSVRELLVVETAQRLDQCLVARWPTLARTQIRELLRSGGVWVNDVPIHKAGVYVQPGDRVAVLPPVLADVSDADLDDILPPLPLAVLYADESVLVIEKPAGMPTHPQRRYAGQTFSEWLSEQYPAVAHVGGAGRAGVVQRVEQEFSGPVLIARSEDAYRALQRAVKRERVTTQYSVLVEGDTEQEARIEAPLRSGGLRGLQTVVREGRPAITEYRRLRHYRDRVRHYTLLEVQTRTAQRHQLRAHLAWYGFPVVGDRHYGARHQPLLEGRLFMHISVLTFAHPLTGEPVRVESALPPDLREVLRFLVKPK